MGQQCFVCEKNIGRLSIGFSIKDLEHNNKEIPNGMSLNDKTCSECYTDFPKSKINFKEEQKQLEKESSTEQKQIMDDIISRVPEYKRRWNKGGVVQYKDEYCAILHRTWGQQVEFIIAYSDLTKEGYRMMAQDEGKTGSGGGFTGGIDSYYYFQKISFVR